MSSEADGRIGFIGLGAMGNGLALNLQQDLKAAGDRNLLVHNRSPGKYGPHIEAGAQAVKSVEGLAEDCAIMFAMLADDAAVRDVFAAVLRGEPPPGAIFADMSTVLPSTTAELAAAAADKGMTYLSCPVFGRPDAVAARKCIMVLSGPEAAKAKVRPLLEPLGRAVLDAGNEAVHGSSMKLTGNFFIASAIELLAEGMTLADATGLPRDLLLQFLKLMLPGVVFEGYGARMAAGDFDRKGGSAGFSVAGGIKDVGHMQKLAAEKKVHMPVVDVVLEHLQAAQAAGRGDDDWSALAAAVRQRSGRPDPAASEDA